MNGINPLKFLDKHRSDLTSYTFAIIIAKYKSQWIFVRHRDRLSWELPAGHVEKGETVDEASHRELFEETGAEEYSISRICSYQGIYKGDIVYGMLFEANVSKLGTLPKSEIAEIKLFSAIPVDLTYPHIQPQLINYYLNL